VHNNFLEEVAKFRAARRLWAAIMRDKFGAKNPKSWQLRCHAQTAGSALTAQQPENNVARVTMQALAAVLGGTQSLHTNGRDEALALPTEQSARIALRTQQIIAYESGAADTIDPLAGSYYVESLTDELEKQARAYLDLIAEMGGTLTAIESGFISREIQEAAYIFQRQLEAGDEVVVGVNKFVEQEDAHMELQRIDPAIEANQRARVAELRANRDNERVSALRDQLTAAANGRDNLMPLLIECVENDLTLGEICHTLRATWGEYRPTYE
jgi:methylmalonyl-CoA mutase N-terminal domain/subunit